MKSTFVSIHIHKLLQKLYKSLNTIRNALSSLKSYKFVQIFSEAYSLKTINLQFLIRKLFWRGLTVFGLCLHSGKNWTDLETSPRGFSTKWLNQDCGEPIKSARKENTIKPVPSSVRGWSYKAQDKMIQTSTSTADSRGRQFPSLISWCWPSTLLT